MRIAQTVEPLLWVSGLSSSQLRPAGCPLSAANLSFASQQWEAKLIYFSRFAVLGLSLAMAAGCAQPEAVPDDQPTSQEAQSAAYNVQPDTAGSGPYAAIKEVRSELPNHVVYRPQDLAGLAEQKLGVVLWGNGGCSADAASARFHLLELASHGYIVIAPGEVRSGPNGVQREREERIQEDGRFPPVETLPKDLIAGLDWILAENARPQSPFNARIDPQAVAVAGHSCGGLQAIKVAADPRIATVIVHNSGVLNPGSPNPITGFTVEKTELKNLHSPALYIAGGESDIAYPNSMDDFSRITHIPVAIGNLDVGHGGTFQEPNGGKVAQVSVKWLNWQLRGDEGAARWFTGAGCALCVSPDWVYDAKGF